MTTTDNRINNLIINKMTKTQFDSLTVDQKNSMVDQIIAIEDETLTNHTLVISGKSGENDFEFTFNVPSYSTEYIDTGEKILDILGNDDETVIVAGFGFTSIATFFNRVEINKTARTIIFKGLTNTLELSALSSVIVNDNIIY